MAKEKRIHASDQSLRRRKKRENIGWASHTFTSCWSLYQWTLCCQVASFDLYSCFLGCHNPSHVVWCFIEIFRCLEETELLMSLPACFMAAMRKVSVFMGQVTFGPRKGTWTGEDLGWHGECLSFLEMKLIHLFVLTTGSFYSCTRADNHPCDKT